MSTVAQFNALCQSHGSVLIFHRDQGSVDCPCLTPEGYRDPEWHLLNPLSPVCNEHGKLPQVLEITFKGFVQPAQSTRATRMTDETLQQLFGMVRTNDHIGILPLTWNGQVLNYEDWSQDGNDWVKYNNQKFLLVTTHILPDPSDGAPHHCECGLRLLTTDVVTVEPDTGILYPDHGLYPEPGLYPEGSVDSLYPDPGLFPEIGLYPVGA